MTNNVTLFITKHTLIFQHSNLQFRASTKPNYKIFKIIIIYMAVPQNHSLTYTILKYIESVNSNDMYVLIFNIYHAKGSELI